MTEYDFKNLDDYEFENLCRDIFNEEQRLITKTKNGLKEKKIISFKSFKRGKDQGIDLRYEDKNDIVIGQVKLSRGKFADLLTSLKSKNQGKTEADKVTLLKPSKYVFFTSVPLSLLNKDKIKELFTPHIISNNDIYGREDLNSLLAQLPHVEKRNLKLYLSNTLVLERILNQATISRSDFFIKEIQKEIKYFVQTDNFLEALNLLHVHNLIMIKGLPGVGKSTLAKMLSLFYFEQGYNFVEIFDLDNELESLVQSSDKLVLYYDDFLGSNSLTIADALRHESRLGSLLRRIMVSANKVLILTTRTNILSNANLHSDKLNKIFESISKYELDITELPYIEKSCILKNHIKKNNLNINIFKEYEEEIINHKSFNPRLIEYITNKINNHLSDNIKNFVFDNLNNPNEVWRFAYNEQTNHTSKIYLNHLFLFQNHCKTELFKKSFNNRINYEVQKNGYSTNNNEFKKCTVLLDQTFIKITLDLQYNERNIEFINPSFVDFLIAEIKNNKKFIEDSVVSFDSIYILKIKFNHENKELEKLLGINTLEKILLNKKSISLLLNNNEKIEYLIICSKYFSLEQINLVFSTLINDLIKMKVNENNIDEYVSFATHFRSIDHINIYLKENFNTLISNLLQEVNYLETFDEIIELFKLFEIDIQSYIYKSDNHKLLINTLKNILEEEIENKIFLRGVNISSIIEIDDFRQEIKTEYYKYIKMLEISPDLLDVILDAKDWDSIIEYYKFKNYGINI